MSALDLVPDSILYEQYSDPTGGITQLAEFYGVSNGVVYRRLSAQADKFADAQALRAYRLHELAIKTLYQEPERIVDAAGNERIDPSSVALLKYRSQEASRIAGILYSKLSERHQVDVTHSASPLSDFLASIAARGSSIPIAPPRTIEGETLRIIEDEPDEADGTSGGIPLE